MKKTPAIIIGAVVVVIALVAVVAASSSSNKNDPSTMSEGMSSSSMSDSTSSTSSADAVATDKVMISNYMFTPGDIKVKVGTTVTWTNGDSVKHNVASDDDKMPEGKLIGKDETYTYTFTKAGTYKYHCTPHSYMHGSVTVE
ncbi:cupredoxin domain-containing protein [Polaromonas sp.]|nr:cupredoxin domain-containing protein [Candidatus Saccharibacteria bacterium]